MYDWIVEADIMRFRRQLSEATSATERRRLEELIRHAQRRLGGAGGAASVQTTVVPRATIGERR